MYIGYHPFSTRLTRLVWFLPLCLYLSMERSIFQGGMFHRKKHSSLCKTQIFRQIFPVPLTFDFPCVIVNVLGAEAAPFFILRSSAPTFPSTVPVPPASQCTIPVRSNKATVNGQTPRRIASGSLFNLHAFSAF